MRETKMFAMRAHLLKPLFAVLDKKYVNRAKLAKKYGIRKESLYKYETGRVQVPADFIDWMIREFDLDPDIISQETRALVESKRQTTTKGA